MKYFTIFSLLLVIFVTYTSAQRCPGAPRRPSCAGAADPGRGGRGCRPSNMWAFDRRTRQCRQMRYLGCGGNNNRHCTRGECQQRCRRG